MALFLIYFIKFLDDSAVTQFNSRSIPFIMQIHRMRFYPLEYINLLMLPNLSSFRNFISQSTKMVFPIKMHSILLPIILTLPIICHLAAPPSPQNNPFFQFFKGLTPQQRQQFFQISTNPALTKPQAQAQFNEFAEQNGIMDSYISFNNSMNQIKERVEAAAEDNLTGQALKVFNQLKAILNNNSQSHGQVCAQANSVLAKTDQSVVEFLPKGMLAACMGVGNGMAQNVGEEVEEEGEEK